MADSLSCTFPITYTARRVKLTLGYRGIHFAGWARQAEGRTAGLPTIQGELERALAEILGTPTPVTAAGRTDAGVHAEGQVVSFDVAGSIPAAGISRLLRRHLPEDVWVVTAEEATAGFNARYSAWRRWYRYFIWSAQSPMPGVWHGRCLEHPEPLNLPAMRQAAAHLVGRIDAAALVTGWGRDARPGRSTWRFIERADFIEPSCSNSPLFFEIGADAFLKQMVRTIVGGLLWVGRGRWSAEDFAAALASGDRRRSGPTAPAHGLTLWKIEYPQSADASQ